MSHSGDGMVYKMDTTLGQAKDIVETDSETQSSEEDQGGLRLSLPLLDVVYDLVRERLEEGYAVSEERIILKLEDWVGQSFEEWTAIGVFFLDREGRVVRMTTPEGAAQGDMVSDDEEQYDEDTDCELNGLG